jgi:hypothetical protein
MDKLNRIGLRNILQFNVRQCSQSVTFTYVSHPVVEFTSSTSSSDVNEDYARFLVSCIR